MIVVDSSAVIAALTSEPGHELVDAAIGDGAAISAVNLAEVVSVMVRRSVAIDLATSVVRDLPLVVI